MKMVSILKRCFWITHTRRDVSNLTLLEKAAMERIADPTIQLNVDLSILDYLLYNAIRAFVYDFRMGSRTEEAYDKHEFCAGTMVQLVACTSAKQSFLHALLIPS